MSSFTILLYVILAISIILNIFLVWYSIKAAKMVLSLVNNLEDLREIIDNFAEHVEQVHELEIFYGDDTLQHLLNHSKELSGVIRDYLR
tara:strand:- start:83 stop:349 length:267 start_codon:yes stop_codon:yes gene_type:complete